MNSELFCSGGKQTALVCVLASFKVEFPNHLQDEACAPASLDKGVSRGRVRGDSAGQGTSHREPNVDEAARLQKL